MALTIRVITPPSEEPVTLDEAKLHCRVDVDVDDTLITALITAAREYSERMAWRSFLTQTIQLWLEAWPPGDAIEIPRPPLQGVNSITWFDEDDAPHVLEASTYFVDYYSEPGRAILRANESWPSTTLRAYNSIVVEYDAGWETAEDVPQHYKQAILLLVGHWYENREVVLVGTISRSIEFAVNALLGIDRAFRF